MLTIQRSVTYLTITVNQVISSNYSIKLILLVHTITYTFAGYR